MHHTLLLNSTYECISFISERKVFKLFANNKIEIISSWEHETAWGRGKISHPAVVRLKHQVRWIPRKLKFHRNAVFKRDRFICQYCGAQPGPARLTIDHIIPRGMGGGNSWKNCVTACDPCNKVKGNRTPEMAGMRLIVKPQVPLLNIVYDFEMLRPKHEEWRNFLNF